MIGLLAFAAPPAFAAGPEVPEATVQAPVHATEATVHGVLDPGKVGEPGTYEAGTYQFLYKASKTKACEGGGVAPVSPVMSLGGGKEEVSEVLPALSADTEYAVCLEFETAAGKAVSAPATFKTALPPEKPVTTSPAEAVTATTATLEGVLNPVKAGEAGSYEFLYRVSPSECEGEGAAPSGSEPTGKMTGGAKQAVTVAVTALEPSATYTFCLLARNGAGETALGVPVHFTTKAAAPTVETESVSSVNATSATLEAQVNPNNQSTTYEFQYSESATGETLHAPVTSIAGAAPLEGFGDQTASATTGAALAPDTTYFYRVITENATHEKREGKVASFTTVASPSTEAVSNVSATTATFTGSVTPLNSTVAAEYFFNYKAGTECSGGSATTSESAGTGSGTQAVATDVTGLLPNTRYTVCLVSSNVFGSEQASPVSFTTLVAAPVIESESSANVDATEARLRATIDPGNSETTYHFEYGPAGGAYDKSIPVPDGKIPAGLVDVSVNVVATGLEPSTTYRYRVVASNALPGTVEGSERTFETAARVGTGSPASCRNEHLREEQPYGLALPDCRAYEMVSPTNTDGQDATSTYAESTARASEAPEGSEPAITYSAKGSFGDPRGALVENQYLSRRTPAGWSTQAITLLSSTGTKGGTEPNEDSYPATYFTPELEAGLAVTSASLGEAPPLGEENPIKVYVAQFAGGTYQYVGRGELPGGASTGLERIVLTNAANGSLLEWANGTDVPVSVTNSEGEVAASAGSGQYFEKEKDAWHATSENGSRVYFTTPPNVEDANEQLDVRVNIGKLQSVLGGEGECLEPTRACTIEVSASQREHEDPHGPQSARYWGASGDGEKVFFTSSAELTEDAYTGVADNAPNLYEYDLGTGKLTDLTVDSEAVSEGAAVQGVAQISEDGSYVYFVAHGKLAPKAVEGEPNLYVSHEGGAPVFIATLGVEDETDWLNGGNASEAGPEINTAVVTPSGAQLAFISEDALTPYDNEQAEPGDCDAKVESHGTESGMCREVYVYDAETQALTCASCNPTGAPPVGPAVLPGVVPAAQAYANYRPRDFLADGSLFFDSSDALAPGSDGGRENVYEYENGAVHAISNVAGGYESFFLDASPNGQNVFFASAARLLPEDPGGNAVVWDARVDGGFPLASEPVPCTSGETCQPPAVPAPAVGGSGSATFTGPGNVPPATIAPSNPPGKPKVVVQTRAQKLARALKLCRKDKARKKRAACEASARKKYGQRRKARNAGDERRASR